MQAKGDHSAQKAQHEALIHKGPANKAVGGAHHAHDGDLLSPVKGGELDGVGDNEHRHDKQNGDQGHAHHCGHVPHRDKAAGDLLIGIDVGNALHILHLFLGLGLLRQIRHFDGVPILQDLRIQILKDLFIRVLGLETLHGLFLGDICDGGHVGQRLQLGFQRLGLSVGIGIVHIGQDLILLFQGVEQLVGVHRHQGKGSHDQKARHGNADSRERHESVAEHVGQALMNEISEIMLTHGAFLPHNRRRSR